MQTWEAFAFYQALNGNQSPSCKFTQASFCEKRAQDTGCLTSQNPLLAKSQAPVVPVVYGQLLLKRHGFYVPLW